MTHTDAARAAVIATAERSWIELVNTVDAGRSAFIDARVRDYNHWRQVAAASDALICDAECPAAPHAHPMPFDDEVADLRRRIDQ